MPVIKTAPLPAMYFTSFMIHALLPDSMLTVLLVPFIKDRAGDKAAWIIIVP